MLLGKRNAECISTNTELYLKFFRQDSVLPQCIDTNPLISIFEGHLSSLDIPQHPPVNVVTSHLVHRSPAAPQYLIIIKTVSPSCANNSQISSKLYQTDTLRKNGKPQQRSTLNNQTADWCIETCKWEVEWHGKRTQFTAPFQSPQPLKTLYTTSTFTHSQSYFIATPKGEFRCINIITFTIVNETCISNQVNVTKLIRALILSLLLH